MIVRPSTRALRTLATGLVGAFVLLATCSDALATAQVEDVLLVMSERYSIQTNPLEPYFAANPGKRPKSEIYSTGLWRGYIATWEISDGALFLTDLQIDRQKQETDDFDTELESVMSAVFPDQRRVFADWFTGYIIAPYGELVEYVHQGYASTFEHYRVFTVLEGLVKAERRMTETEFRRFRDAQFRAYQETEEYATERKRLADEDDTPEEMAAFLFRLSGARYMSIIFDRKP